jgi:Family of unknown function (DUF6459)
MPETSEPTEPATTVPALPQNAIPVPLIPPAISPTGGRPRTTTRTGGRPRAKPRTGGRRPLPDAQAIYRFTVPEIAPPYDDSAPRRPRQGAGRGGLTSLPAEQGPARSHAASRDSSSQLPRRQDTGNQPPETGPWPSRFAQVLAETLAGSRPADQIMPWTTEQARRRISQLGPMLATEHRPRIRRVIVSSPASGVLEMTVIVGLGSHVRAVAVRLERASERPPGERPAGEPSARAATRPSQLAQPGRLWRPDNRSANRRQPSSSEWLCTAIEAA